MSIPIIRDIIQDKDVLYIFTDTPKKDIEFFQIQYEEGESNVLGYESPNLFEYTFLGGKYPAIQLWFDGESKVAEEAKEKLLNNHF